MTRQRVAVQLDSELELTQAEAAFPIARERIASLNESIALLNNQLVALQGKGPDAGLVVCIPTWQKSGSSNSGDSKTTSRFSKMPSK